MESTVGSINITFSVKCPHCNYDMDDYNETIWWRRTMGISFPTDGVDGTYEAKCPKCDNEFNIEGFEQ